MKDKDLVPGVDYCYKTRNSRYDSFEKRKGTYIRRTDPGANQKRSRTHVLTVDNHEVLIDASFILCRWSEHVESDEYKAAYSQTLHHVREQENQKAIREWMSLTAVILGLKETTVGTVYGRADETLTHESQLLAKFKVSFDGLEVRDLLVKLGLPVPPLNLLSEESTDLQSLIGDIKIKSES